MNILQVNIYSGIFLLRTLWDQVFLGNFCCNIEVFLFQRLKMPTVGTKIFVIMEVFPIESLIRRVC